jgi:hypothetical protein
MEPRASHMLGKHCTTKLHPRPQPFILNRNFSLASWRQLVCETVSGKKCITNRASGRAELVRQTNKQTNMVSWPDCKNENKKPTFLQFLPFLQAWDLWPVLDLRPHTISPKPSPKGQVDVQTAKEWIQLLKSGYELSVQCRVRVTWKHEGGCRFLVTLCCGCGCWAHSAFVCVFLCWDGMQGS